MAWKMFLENGRKTYFLWILKKISRMGILSKFAFIFRTRSRAQTKSFVQQESSAQGWVPYNYMAYNFYVPDFHQNL